MMAMASGEKRGEAEESVATPEVPSDGAGERTEGVPADRLREVVGRRGYDEAEDEEETEDERH